MKMKFAFNIESIIEGNLALQSVARILQNEYKIYNPNLKLLTSEKFINSYNNWPSSKKENFIRLIAGRANFKKGLNFFNRLGENNGL